MHPNMIGLGKMSHLLKGQETRSQAIAKDTRYSVGINEMFSLKVKVKMCLALYGKPFSELWNVTCHMGSHTVTCHPTQLNAPRLNPSQ